MYMKQEQSFCQRRWYLSGGSLREDIENQHSQTLAKCPACDHFLNDNTTFYHLLSTITFMRASKTLFWCVFIVRSRGCELFVELEILSIWRNVCSKKMACSKIVLMPISISRHPIFHTYYFCPQEGWLQKYLWYLVLLEASENSRIVITECIYPRK